ncbi:MAG: SHOCT domain-containing protein [Nitrospiraceae bacterium]
MGAGGNRPTVVAQFFVHAILLACLGCATTPPASRVVYEDEERVVRLAVNYRGSAKEHSHPAALSQAQLTAVLEAVSATPRAPQPQGPFDYATRPTGSEPSALFSDEVTKFISRHVTEALQRATPLEDVEFYLNLPREKAIREITSGALYIEDDQLHLRLANYRHPTVGEHEVNKTRAHPLTVLAKPSYEIDPGPYGKVKPQKGWKSLVTVFPQHVVIEYRALLRSVDRTGDVRNSSKQQKISPESSVADRLRELNELRDEGLITEEEFQEMRRKLLDSY